MVYRPIWLRLEIHSQRHELTDPQLVTSSSLAVDIFRVYLRWGASLSLGQFSVPYTPIVDSRWESWVSLGSHCRL